MGSFGGALSSIPATRLGSLAIKEALSRAGVSGSDVGEVFMGNVLSAGLGQAPARQAALGAGIGTECPCTTVNKVCSSGMKALALAAQSVALGHCDVAVAGGMESMSNAPYIVPKARFGARMGSTSLVDSMMSDGLTDAYSGKAMGMAGEVCAREYSISRRDQDAHAAESYRRATEATREGRFEPEIVPVQVPARRRGRKPRLVGADEEPGRGPGNAERFGKLRPVFDRKNGTITAANASTISDGAAALVVVSERWYKQRGASAPPALCRLVSTADFAQAPVKFTTAPAGAMKKALRRAGIAKMSDISLFEINEAFSVVACVNQNLLDLPPSRVNVNGGAVALGHPLGCSGARIVVTLIHALRKRGGRYGMAGICNGGGGASALVVDTNVSR